MTLSIDTIEAIASNYDVVVFDQWGVLHNGTEPYAGAIEAVHSLKSAKAVLSNSGKRSSPNEERITSMGFGTGAFDFVMTSGEALWRDLDQSQITAKRFFAVERATGDAGIWSKDLDIELTTDAAEAEAILMMGLPDHAEPDDWADILSGWFDLGLPMYCSNPDRKSPRADGFVMSPGALAFAYQQLGGETTFYGKPHRPVFDALETVFGSGRYLMVGDSMEHDIAGAQHAGWDSLLVEGGLYVERFAEGNGDDTVKSIAAETGCVPPTYRIKGVR